MSRFLYPIRRLKVMPWIKYWMIKRTAGSLSEILENLTSPITLNNSLRRKFHIFEIGGNSVQDGTPTPENPIPIQNVSGSVDVKVENKNLLPDVKDKTIQTNNGITVTYLEDGKINIKGTATSTSQIWYYLEKDFYIKLDKYVHLRNNAITSNVALGFYNDNTQYFYLSCNRLNRIDKISPMSGATSEDIVRINRMKVQVQPNTTVDITIQPSIENSNDITSYAPHEEQTVTFPTQEGQVLHLGDTLEDDGVHQRRKTHIFNGNESWQKSDNIFNRRITDMKVNSNCLMAHFIFNKVTVNNLNVNEFTTIGGSGKYVYVKADFATEEDFQTFIREQYANGTPVTLEYELAEPIIVPYTEAQQEAYNKIKALYTYKGTTHISSDNSPSPIFKIQYVKEE